ncbi:glycosyl transferase group 1 [Desulfarculus baarsii DSM 2075]|uniref:Glycosyl transferase group 1 n=1 Tax=Desulfarculus baarsii (strain ATCC 33931 / DSM 2075 / LMG 7858 / VKM B-1802 / 2st14) TaxID=644282 RepID=E1QLM1_DESB2|nr:glycosyltransferase [Desulfarculus baarsii]ADK86456.1 glycosyl transferase group 1 [Desulfarculus baarsii DSM 2075]
MEQSSPQSAETNRAGGVLGVLALTSQYPNPAQPGAASFNRQLFAALAKLCRLSLVAPTPWPLWLRGRGAGRPAAGFPVRRPCYFYPPGFARQLHGWCYYFSARRAVLAAARASRPDVLLATWAYPDGWAGLRLAHALGLPLVLKLHGSDVNDQPNDPRRRPLIEAALAGAAAVVCPSQALAQRARELGAAAAKVFVAPNGVDTALFQPRDKAACRRELGLATDGPLLLFVGRLVEVKQPWLAIEALGRLPEARLIMLGEGPLRSRLAAQAAQAGLAGRVFWAGDQPHAQVARFMAAADCLCLTSRAEGSPNVVREALAAGLPVAAFAVGGVPELLTGNPHAALVTPGDAAALVRAVASLLGHASRPTEVAAASGALSWTDSAATLFGVLRRAAGKAA